MFSPGESLAGRYRVEEFIARGGMGVVYRAHDLELDVPLAIKTIRPEIASDTLMLRRLKQEVLLARSISHPHVCRVYDIGRDDQHDVLFLTMELLQGVTLSHCIRSRGSLGPDEALPLVRQMASALDAAHRAGVVHRDFKSSNIMLVAHEDGQRVVITDFGLAFATHTNAADASAHIPRALFDSAADTTHPTVSSEFHQLVGTPEYMAPEQVSGIDVSASCDLYSLGVVLYEMTTGQLPFRGSTPQETAQIRLSSDPRTPRSISNGIPPEWERAVLRLLAREPSDRYASGHDLVLDLEGRLTSVNSATLSVPAERDTFVGREQELHELSQFLESDPDSTTSGRLLTILGAGGIGKTRLAQRYGWASRPFWSGGIWFCDLSEAETLEGMVATVASCLEVPLGRSDPVLQLGHAIAGRGRALIILDNFETVARFTESTLRHWHERCSDTRFLVTSRERLRLPGEHTLLLGSLDPHTHGVELFRLRAESHRPGLDLHHQDRALVDDIVAQLDGIPLAIELAAARLRTLSIRQLRERLRDSFQVLSGGRRGRHETLETALRWSWDLLLPWEKAAASQASVFEGGFTLQAAEEILDLSVFPSAPATLDVIQSLLDKSWLRSRVANGVPRFSMYATMQAFASPRLGVDPVTVGSSATPSRKRIEGRHARYFAKMGDDGVIESLKHHGGVERLATLRTELDNLLSACRNAVELEDPHAAVGALAAAWVVLNLSRPGPLTELAERVSLLPTLEPADRARVQRTLGETYWRSGRMDDAQRCLEESIAIFRDLGYRQREGKALGSLGGIHLHAGDPQKGATEGRGVACHLS